MSHDTPDERGAGPEGFAEDEPGLALDDLSDAERRHRARRLLLRASFTAPLVVGSLLTSKAVAATKVVLDASIPLSL